MKNIIDYIGEYGKFSFSDKPFNKVDSLILTQFSYFKLNGFVPEVGTMKPGVTIRSIANRDDVSDMFTDERYRKNNEELFSAMAESNRFGNASLNHFIDLVSNKWEMQFSALCAYLPEECAHVVFRGTDETVVGWKEDFNMSYMTPIPAQVKAVDYLHYAAERIRGDFSVGGHSKGGNLAVYSAMKCSRLVRDRISSIYSMDGPGFTKETLEDAEFDAIKDRIQKYVPHSSIIGMLLQTQEEYRVIEARSVGILQHDPFNWAIDGDDFVYVKDPDARFGISDASVLEWTRRAKPEEMKVFVDKVYEVFTEAGINDLNDFRGNWSTIMVNAKSVLDSLDEEEKTRIKAVISVFIDSVKGQIKDKIGIK